MPDIFLSIIIPAFNETKRIVSTIESVNNFFLKKKIVFEIIVVDDGSTDDLKTCLTNNFNDSIPLHYETYAENRGKGFAVRYGYSKAKGEYLIYLDADASTPIEEFDKLYKYIEEYYDVVIGSRAIQDETVKLKAKQHRVIIGRIFNFVVNLLCVPEIKDTQCGFKLFTKKSAELVFSKQTLNGFSFDCELLFIAKIYNLKIKEVAINWYNMEGSRVNLLSDPFKMFFDLLRIRLNYIRGLYN